MLNRRLNPTRLKQIVLYTLALAAYCYIVNRLIGFRHWHLLADHIRLDFKNGLLIFLFPVLGAMNLFFESKKWQALISPFVHIPLSKALHQVLAGCLTAVGSPARLAEPGGRILMMDKGQALNTLMMTAIGGLMQNVIIGLTGLAVLLSHPPPGLQAPPLISNALYYALIPLLITVSVLLLYRYFKVPLYRILDGLRQLPPKPLFNSLLYTILRYVTYNIQLLLLFNIFNVTVTLEDMITLFPLYYLLITIIPSFILADIGIRGSVALFIFKTLDSPEPLILCVIFILWFFNIVLPAVLGGWVLKTQSSEFGLKAIMSKEE